MAADERLLEVFILTPDGPVTLHLHPSATITTIAPLVCKSKRWQHEHMASYRFCLKTGAPIGEGASLAVLGLDLSPCPTLLLLPVTPQTTGANSTDRSFHRSATSAAADVKGAHRMAEDRAAKCLQAHVRPMLARLDERQEHAFRLRMLCARAETRAALFVQLIWRARKARAAKCTHGSEAQRETTRDRSLSLRARALQVRAAATVKRIREEQEAAKVRQRESETYATLEYARLEREAQLKREREAEQERREAAAIVRNAIVMLQRWWRKRPKPPPPPEPPPPGFIHKQTAFRAFGRLQLVTWRLRHVEVTQDALCYYHVRRRSQRSSSRASGSAGFTFSHERVGEAKLIPLGAVSRVCVQRDDKRVLVLQCQEREFFFRLPSRAICDEWAAKLSVVAAVRAAGAADAAKDNCAQADSTTSGSGRTSDACRGEAV